MTPTTNLSLMIVGTKAALAQGKRRLQKYQLWTIPWPREDPRKEEKREQKVIKRKRHPSWTRSWTFEGVCKPSGGPLTNSSTGPSRTGEGKILPVDVGIHKPNATSELAWIRKASLQFGNGFHTSRLSASKPIKTTDITGVFCLIVRSSRSTPNGPSRKTTTCRFWWIPGDATVTAYSNGEQLSVVIFYKCSYCRHKSCLRMHTVM